MVSRETRTPTLYEAGWRQGSIFQLDLSAQATRLGLDGALLPVQTRYSTWVVVSQDCDLAGSDVHRNDTVVAIRPVSNSDAPDDWGIRSSKLLLDAERYVTADSPLTLVSPALLTRAALDQRESPLQEGRALALKTWLGLRFDRPAVPKSLLALAQDVAKRVRRRGGRETALGVHDVLIQVDESTEVPRVALFAIVEHETEFEKVRRWLADVARAVPPSLGVVSAVTVGTKAEASLELLETSYAADASQITWYGPEPEGAV